MSDHAHTLSDFRVATLSMECEPCGRHGRYNIAKPMEQYGDAKLPELLYILAACPKARSTNVAKAVYGKDSRWSTSSSLGALLTSSHGNTARRAGVRDFRRRERA
jgi:hypothetical protein